jgi:hypothetical protein
VLVDSIASTNLVVPDKRLEEGSEIFAAHPLSLEFGNGLAIFKATYVVLVAPVVL